MIVFPRRFHFTKMSTCTFFYFIISKGNVKCGMFTKPLYFRSLYKWKREWDGDLGLQSINGATFTNVYTGHIHAVMNHIFVWSERRIDKRK